MRTYNIIKSYYPTFTKGEKKIADFILNDDEMRVTQMTTGDMAKTLRLGEASLIRFCRKIGFGGYLDLKFALAVDYSTQQQGTQNDGSYMSEIKDGMIDAINGTEGLISQSVIARCVELISMAKHIFIYGAGSSSIIARIAEERLMRVGVVSKAVTESHQALQQSAICNSGDLAIAFSVTGNTRDVNKAVNVARESGAKVIAVTSHVASEIAKLADEIIVSCGKENPIEGGNYTTFASMIFIISVLCAEYTVRNERSVESKERVGRTVARETT